MTTVAITPKNDETLGWEHHLPRRTPQPPLTNTITVDWAVIGGGVTGLAAARRIASNQPQASVAILEAGQSGQGAQGRNAGFIIDTPHNVSSSLSALTGAREYMTLARTAIASLEAQVRAHDIQCDWDPIGKLHAAVTSQGEQQVLKPTVRMLDKLHEPYEWLDASALRDRVGFGHFKSGIYTPGTVLVNPAALSRGLADNLPPNVTLYEHTPVISYTHAPEIVLKTPYGTVRAGKLMIAASVFTGQLGFLRDNLIPVVAYASLTRPLTANEQETLQGQRTWGITPANAFVGTTLRRTSDQRILIRQDVRYRPGLRADKDSYAGVAQHHRRLFDQYFPQIRGVEIEHTWAGFICLSANGSPAFGELAPDVFVATADNGVGWTKGTIAGELIADKACGVDNPHIALYERMGQPSALPSRPFLDLGVRLRFGWELWRNRREA